MRSYAEHKRGMSATFALVALLSLLAVPGRTLGQGTIPPATAPGLVPILPTLPEMAPAPPQPLESLESHLAARAAPASANAFAIENVFRAVMIVITRFLRSIF